MQLLQGWDTGLKLSPRHPASKWSRSQTLRRLRTSNLDVRFRVFICFGPRRGPGRGTGYGYEYRGRGSGAGGRGTGTGTGYRVTNPGVNGLNPKITRPTLPAPQGLDGGDNMRLPYGTPFVTKTMHPQSYVLTYNPTF